MSFIEVQLSEDSVVYFQLADDLAESRGYQPRGAGPKGSPRGITELAKIADAANEMGRSLRERIQPDEMTLEIGVGLSAEVGWFFAKSTADGSLKVTLKWKKPAEPSAGLVGSSLVPAFIDPES